MERNEMKVYGTDICIDCRNYKAIQVSRGFDAEFIDITENTTNLREFLSIRDTNEALSWIGQKPVCEEEIVERRE
jgi:glutaredoxin-related protein